jgi:molecular chaperone DnaK (HSP70)
MRVPAPADHSFPFTPRSTVADFQDAIDVEIYEGERPMCEGNNHLGHFVIRGIERAKRGEPQIEVTLDIDTNGVLNVSAMDLTTKVRADITIANALGHLQPEDIERMQQDAIRMSAEDAERAAVVEARMAVEQAVYQCKDMAGQRNSERLKKVAEDVTEWLQDGPGSLEDAALASFAAKRAEIEKAMAVREAPVVEDEVTAFLRAKVSSDPRVRPRPAPRASPPPTLPDPFSLSQAAKQARAKKANA